MGRNFPTQATSNGARNELVYGWWDQMPSHLKTKIQLRAAGLKPGRQPRARIEYGRGRRSRCYDLFDVHEAVQKREPTAAQQAALEKAQRVRRTCVVCGEVKERPGQLNHSRVCWSCVYWDEAYSHLQDRDAMIVWARHLLLDNPDSVVILDTETHDLHGRVVEVGVIDLTGTVLFESLVNPQVPTRPKERALAFMPIRNLKAVTTPMRTQRQRLDALLGDTSAPNAPLAEQPLAEQVKIFERIEASKAPWPTADPAFVRDVEQAVNAILALLSRRSTAGHLWCPRCLDPITAHAAARQRHRVVI